MPEKNYGFRRRLSTVHQPGRRNPKAVAAPGEVAIESGWRLVIPLQVSPCLLRAAQDFQDYLLRSMDVSVLLVRGRADEVLAEAAPRAIMLGTRDDLPDLGEGLDVPRSYRVICRTDAVVLCGADDRGTAQGCYYLEDLMNLREAPFLEEDDRIRSPVFQPRMVHSGWGIDQFPDSHLSAIAHDGRSAGLCQGGESDHGRVPGFQ
jgi:hypothetical protein